LISPFDIGYYIKRRTNCIVSLGKLCMYGDFYRKTLEHCDEVSVFA
jgi:hypothetical protein